MIVSFLLVNCGGGGGGGDAGPAVYPRFAYVANASDGTISIYTVNATTGQMRHNGYVSAGTSPLSVAVDPKGRFAYAANYGSNNVSVYTINQATGALTSGATVTAGTWPYYCNRGPHRQVRLRGK